MILARNHAHGGQCLLPLAPEEETQYFAGAKSEEMNRHMDPNYLN